jgi:hypothetical protein
VHLILVSLCALLMAGTSVARADSAGVVPKKLVLIHRSTLTGPRQKLLLLARDANIHKGAAADVAAVSARLDISWNGMTGSFLMSAGGYDGTSGWVANKGSVAKYVNKAASSDYQAVRSAVVRPGRGLRVSGPHIGGVPLFQEPVGDIAVCYTVTNGSEVHRLGARWPATACSYDLNYNGNPTARLVCTGGGVADPSCSASCSAELAPNAVAPALLSETGLFADIVTKTVATYARPYAPQYQLWADGAAKNRWIYLPRCTQIDTSDMDVWSFPVGARAWKQFDEGGVLLETRMVHRYGSGPDDFLFAVYQWNAGSTEATLVTSGAEDVKGTEHDIPSSADCQSCHGSSGGGGGLPSRYLGFSAIQLSHAGPGVTMASLSADGLLTNPASAGFTIPGTATEQAALGYLHANCANCHNTTSSGLGFLGMEMRVRTTDATAGATGVYTTVVNQPVVSFVGHGCDYRVAGGDTGDSCVHFRMSERGSDTTPNGNQMPPLASDVVDASGLATIATWIMGLPPPPP